MREAGSDDNDLIERLAADDRIPMDAAALRAAIGDPDLFIGNAPAQVRTVVAKIEAVTRNHQEAASYRPESIL